MREQSDASEIVLIQTFELKSLDVRVYRMLLKYGPVKVDTLAKKMGRERSTIYRSLCRLLTAGICYRKDKDVPSGGKYHLYFAAPKSIVAQKMRTKIKDYTIEMNKLIRKFEREF